MKKISKLALGGAAAAVLTAASMGAGPVLAQNGKAEDRSVTLHAELTALNGSGASGTATAVVKNQKIEHIEVHATGLAPDAPHAQHIHYGNDALNECPTLAMDSNADGRINTVEGIPAYGPVVVSLNTTGDTTPASFLDVARFPVSQDGNFNYSRDNIEFTDVAGTGYPARAGPVQPSRSPIPSGTAKASWSSTAWITTGTGPTTSAILKAPAN